MNGRNKKFLDNAFFLASASDLKHPLDRYPGDHHTVIFYLPFSDLGSPDPDLGSVERPSGAGVFRLSGVYF